MAHKTRGHQDLNTLRVVIGASKQLPQTDLPSLRDILAAGLYIKETSITHAKKINIFDLSVTLADQVISVHSKASFEFQPGNNMLPIKSIRKKKRLEEIGGGSQQQGKGDQVGQHHQQAGLDV